MRDYIKRFGGYKIGDIVRIPVMEFTPNREIGVMEAKRKSQKAWVTNVFSEWTLEVQYHSREGLVSKIASKEELDLISAEEVLREVKERLDLEEEMNG